MDNLKVFLDAGALGVLALTLVGAFMIVVRLITVLRDTGAIIQANTDAIKELKSMKQHDTGILEDIRDRLLERPCMIDRKHE